MHTEILFNPKNEFLKFSANALTEDHIEWNKLGIKIWLQHFPSYTGTKLKKKKHQNAKTQKKCLCAHLLLEIVFSNFILNVCQAYF